MIYPKLQASQELALHRVAVQEHGFIPQLLTTDASNNTSGTTAAAPAAAAIVPGGGFNANTTGNSFLRASSTRSESQQMIPLAGSGAVNSSFSSSRNDEASLGAIAGGGANSTASVSIVRPETRIRQEWVSSLDDIDIFVLPEHQLCGSQPATRQFVTAHYITDQYDRQWLARRATTMTMTSATKGKSGVFDSVVSPSPASSLLSFSKHRISLSLFEDLMTAFELGSYYNPEIPVQRQPVFSFDSVIATGADRSVVEEVRQYWLGKRHALGGNVPCIPALRMNVREDNQTTLCHSDIITYCPLPFNHRDWSIAALQRRAVQGQNATLLTEGMGEVKEENKVELSGIKRRRDETETQPRGEKSFVADEPTAEDRMAAETKELCMLVSSGLNVAQAVLEREECKLAHAHLAIYELALLRRAAMMGRDSLSPNSGSPIILPCVDDALQEDWVAKDVAFENLYDGESDGVNSVAVESVMGIENFFY